MSGAGWLVASKLLAGQKRSPILSGERFFIRLLSLAGHYRGCLVKLALQISTMDDSMGFYSVKLEKSKSPKAPCPPSSD
jgi:hypothetical protein